MINFIGKFFRLLFILIATVLCVDLIFGWSEDAFGMPVTLGLMVLSMVVVTGVLAREL